MSENKSENLMYKGRALVRCKNDIYYGNPTDSYIVFMQILSFDNVAGEQVAGKIHMQLISNDQSLNGRDRIIKESDKVGLYGALDFAHIWLERANAGKL